MLKIDCPHCGHKIDSETVICPTCKGLITLEVAEAQRSRKFSRVAVVVLLGVAAFVLIKRSGSSSSESEQQSSANLAQDTSPQIIDNRPNDQIEFEQIYKDFEASSDSGNGINDAKKRDEKIIAFCEGNAKFIGVHREWIGEVESIQPANPRYDEKAKLNIYINYKKEIIKSEMDEGSQIYKDALLLKAGSSVKFNFKFKGIPNNDMCIDTSSDFRNGPAGFAVGLGMHDIAGVITNAKLIVSSPNP